MAQSYLHSTVVRLSAIALNAVGGLVLVPFILHSLGKTEFGIWAMAASITGYLMLLDFGIALACTRYLALQNTQRQQWQRTISSTMLLSLGLMLLLILAAVLVQWESAWSTQHRTLADVMTILLVEVALSLPLRLYQSVLRAEVRYADIGWFELIRIVLRLLGIPLVLWLGGKLMGIVLYSSAINVLFFALMLLSVWIRNRTLYLNWVAYDWQHVKALLSFSQYAAISQVAEFFRYRTDNLLLGMWLGVGAVAPFALLIVLIDMFTQILMRFQGYWDTLIMQAIGQKQRQQAWATMLTSLSIGLALALLAVIGTGFLGTTFLTLWVGTSYTDLAPALTLFTLTLVNTSVQLASTPYLQALGKQRTVAWLGVAEMGLKLLFLLPLINHYGFYGMIYASLAAGFITTGLRWYVLQHNKTSYR